MGLSSARPSRTRLVLSTLAVVTIAAVGATSYHLLTRQDSDGTGPETAVVERGTVSLTASATGTVTPSRQWSLGFTTDAEITAVNVAAGDQVAKGDILAKADDADAAELVDEAETALEEAEDDLAGAEDDADECESASTPTAGTGTAGQGGATQPAQTGCQSTGTDAILTAQQRVNQAEADLAAAQDTLDATVLTAPADATVLSVSAGEGTSLSAGTVLIELGSLSAVSVVADFPEADTAALSVGQAVTVALADSEDAIDAEIGSIALTGTATEDFVTYAVSIGVADPPESVRSGSSATVDIVLASVDDALSVPVSALESADGDTAQVTVLAADGTTRTETVTTGLYGDSGVEILSGLAEGDTVVIGR
ncbi:efflux RND transporter periplasmic adaptor subunit [Glycomyces rhizosphaerae]|uniref:Efflux RND transporter periplasmic adaptor subunit n=1 Tax=Glycomyces rhizosphaerae TaxID=2054422 RepID=A0ABV7Q8M8_9ACTN